MEQHPIGYTAVYDDLDSALVQLEMLEDLRKRELIGSYAGAVLERHGGESRIVVRAGDELPAETLRSASDELADGQAAFVFQAEATVEHGLDAAVARLTDKVKHPFPIAR